MNIKVLKLFAFIFIFQFIISCCNIRRGGNGTTSSTSEVEYDDISITALNTSGLGYAVEVSNTDTVYRNAFGLKLLISNEQKQMYSNQGRCDYYGGDQEYIFTDTLDYAEVLVTNVATNEEVNISTLFGTYEYNNEPIPLNEIFDNEQDSYGWYSSSSEFNFELFDFDSIPSTAVFTANVYLKSGAKLTAQTKQINFYD